MSIARWLFGGLPYKRKIRHIRKKAVMLGARIKEGRKFYFFLLHGFFVEILFTNDNLDAEPERLRTFGRIADLNSYLSKEFRTTF